MMKLDYEGAHIPSEPLVSENESYQLVEIVHQVIHVL